jgi:hypothetical protein
VRIAVDMVEERLISKEDAIKRIPADSLAHLLAPIFDRKSIASAKKNRERPGRRPRRGLRSRCFQRGGSGAAFAAR